MERRKDRTVAVWQWLTSDILAFVKRSPLKPELGGSGFASGQPVCLRILGPKSHCPGRKQGNNWEQRFHAQLQSPPSPSTQICITTSSISPQPVRGSGAESDLDVPPLPRGCRCFFFVWGYFYIQQHGTLIFYCLNQCPQLLQSIRDKPNVSRCNPNDPGGIPYRAATSVPRNRPNSDTLLRCNLTKIFHVLFIGI